MAVSVSSLGASPLSVDDAYAVVSEKLRRLRFRNNNENIDSDEKKDPIVVVAEERNSGDDDDEKASEERETDNHKMGDDAIEAKESEKTEEQAISRGEMLRLARIGPAVC